MPLHRYKAMDAAGRLRSGRLDAVNLVDLEARLKRIGLDLIDAKAMERGGFGGLSVTRRELITFTLHLEHLTHSGVPLLDSLFDVRDSLENLRFREIVADLIEQIEGGKTFSQALSAHPRVFDTVYVSLIRAGEISGLLPDTLHSLAEALKWQDELATQTRKLLLYPGFMGLIVILATLFMMLYLVPQMTGFIKSMGQTLPLHTRMLIATSEIFVHHGHLILGLLLVVATILTLVFKLHSATHDHLDAFKLRLPWLGEILRKIILSRFASLFATLYVAGISIPDALRISQDVAGNRVIRRGLEHATALIDEGQNVTHAFVAAGLFPPLVIRMLRVGENTGALDTALANVSYFYNRDVRESIARLHALLEPAMTLVIGLLLGWVMLSVLGPIYDTISRLKL